MSRGAHGLCRLACTCVLVMVLLQLSAPAAQAEAQQLQADTPAGGTGDGLPSAAVPAGAAIPPPTFRKIGWHFPLLPGFRDATCAEARANQALVLALVTRLEICGVVGGTVRGSRSGVDTAPGNTVLCPDPTAPVAMSCRIIVQDLTARPSPSRSPIVRPGPSPTLSPTATRTPALRLKKLDFHAPMPEGYRLATCQEARSNLEAAVSVTSYLDICAVAGGTVRGSRRGYDSAPGLTVLCPDPDPPASFGCKIAVQDFSDAFVGGTDGICPGSSRLITYEEASYFQNSICDALRRQTSWEWSISRLAGAGSMDGPGYRCGVRPVDTRGLGASLCVPEEPVVGAGPCRWYDVQGRPGLVPLQAQTSCAACQQICSPAPSCIQYSWGGGLRTQYSSPAACAAPGVNSTWPGLERLDSGGACLPSNHCILSEPSNPADLAFQTTASTATNTSTYALCLQNDRNIVVYRNWTSTNAPTQIQQLLDVGATPVWASHTVVSQSTDTYTSCAHGCPYPGVGGPFKLCLNSNGYLVGTSRATGIEFWRSGQAGGAGAQYSASLRPDGNLVVFARLATDVPVWSTQGAVFPPPPSPDYYTNYYTDYPPNSTDYDPIPPTPPSPAAPTLSNSSGLCRHFGITADTRVLPTPAGADASCAACQASCNASAPCFYYAWNNTPSASYTRLCPTPTPEPSFTTAFAGNGDGGCPSGSRIVNPREAAAHRTQICRALRVQATDMREAGDLVGYGFVFNSVLRLDGGGFFEGPGFECTLIGDEYTNSQGQPAALQATLCVPVASSASTRVDCRVAWTWGLCNARCGGGRQQMRGTVLQYPANGGVQCPNLSQVVACNTQPC